MGLFDRIVAKATPYAEDYDEYAEDYEDYDSEEYLEDPEVASLQPVA